MREVWRVILRAAKDDTSYLQISTLSPELFSVPAWHTQPALLATRAGRSKEGVRWGGGCVATPAHTFLYSKAQPCEYHGRNGSPKKALHPRGYPPAPANRESRRCYSQCVRRASPPDPAAC